MTIFPLKTREEAKAHCRFVGVGIEKRIADGENLSARFEGTPVLRFKEERVGGRETVVCGELGGGSGAETRGAMAEFFAAACRGLPRLTAPDRARSRRLAPAP